uniref:Uncharacterized protein n=1 Tax=Cuerna arida TaxID=1464854 RepID=A0A1B6GP71_9HEMI
MRDPRLNPQRESSQGSRPVQPVPVSIPPPPLPPRFPPSNTPANQQRFPLPITPFPPRFPQSNFPSQNPSIPPPQFPSSSHFPSQTFHGVPTPQWSTPPQQTQHMSWSHLSVPQEGFSYNRPDTKMCMSATSQEVTRPCKPPQIWSQPQCSQNMCISSVQSSNKPDPQSVIDDWLKRRKILSDPIKPAAKNVQIYVVKEKLNQAFRLIRELENGARTLTVMVKTVTPLEWDRKCQEIEVKKKELMDVLKDLKLSKEEIKTLKEKCSKRSKKRARLRRQAERRKKQKEKEVVKEQNINIQIDNWQREMQEEVERVQREEDLQKQADAVLWGVTQEKTEAKRQVALLSRLLELRQVRVKRLTAAGRPASQLQIETFNTVIERLKKMWTKLLDRCQLEEQALRGMLIEADIKSDPIKTHKKLVLQEWETALFGDINTLDNTPQGNQLVDIRRSWDQFAVQGPTVLSSTVPPGWVLPVPPSSDQWHSLLKY